MPTRIKISNDTSATLSSPNPTLAAGELCFEIDTGFAKLGDGTTPWNSLPYIGSGGDSIPDDVLRNVTPGVVLHQNDNSLVGSDFVAPGYYVKKVAAGWDFPPNLQEQSLERFAITTSPYTLNFADMRLGMIFLQSDANASVILPSGVVASPSIANLRTYHDVLFYIDGAVTVTFIPDTGVSLFVPGQVAAAESYAVAARAAES